MAGVTGVKVCGLTCAEDVRLAAELGAWALGFVLTESPRRLDAAAAARLIAVTRDDPDVTRRDGRAASSPLTVLVVTREPAEWVADALAVTGADAVQLSAGADGPLVTDVVAAAAPTGRRPLVIAAADTPDAPLADLVLLDARAPSAYGGTGETLDWEALAAGREPPAGDLVLAGGLRPGNVGRAIALLHPRAVDVASGVEAAPGRKDHAALRAFFAAVEDADREATARVAAPTARRTAG